MSLGKPLDRSNVGEWFGFMWVRSGSIRIVRKPQREQQVDRGGSNLQGSLTQLARRRTRALGRHSTRKGNVLKYLHTMVRVADLEGSLDFYCGKLGLKEIRRMESKKGRFTLVFLAVDEDDDAMVELTYNWDSETYSGGRNFGHLAYSVENIYEKCQSLMDAGVTINRPPRDGRMAFIRSPDNISVELLQDGAGLPIEEPWASMPNVGDW